MKIREFNMDYYFDLVFTLLHSFALKIHLRKNIQSNEIEYEKDKYIRMMLGAFLLFFFF